MGPVAATEYPDVDQAETIRTRPWAVPERIIAPLSKVAMSMVTRASYRGLLALLALATCTSLAQAKDPILRVVMNQARILKLDRPVSKVIIGNEKVADATVADPSTIVVTGRGFGATNLVLLDRDGNPIFDQQVLVSIDEGNTVRLYKQTDRTVLSCTPACEAHSQLKAESGDSSSASTTGQ